MFCDQTGMFVLGGKRPVFGGYGPAVLFVKNYIVSSALIDHRLDGESHSGAHSGPGSTAGIMGYGRLLMEVATDSVAREIPHNSVTPWCQVGINGITDLRNTFIRLDAVNSDPHGPLRVLHQLPGFIRKRWNVEHPGSITVIALVDYSNINVQNVTGPENLCFFGDSVAYYLIYGGADGTREAPVIEWSRLAAPTQSQGMGKIVQLEGAYSRLHPLPGLGKDLCRQATGVPHTLDFRFALDVHHATALFLAAFSCGGTVEHDFDQGRQIVARSKAENEG